MDIGHLLELAIVAAAGWLGNWITIKAEVKQLREWRKEHDDSDDMHFAQVNARIDNLILRQTTK